MTQPARPKESAALLCALLTAQWFSSAAAGFADRAGNAVYWAILLAGAMLLAAYLLFDAITPREGLLLVCARSKLLRVVPLAAAAGFLLLCAAALRDGLTMLELSLLPETPRWFALALALPAIGCMAVQGLQAVQRAVKLVAPVLILLYLLVLLAALWGQFDVYNLFPLFGAGADGIRDTATSALSAAVWLPLLLLEKDDVHRRRAGLRGILWATALTAVGYFSYALLFPMGTADGVAFPLHELTAAGGLSVALQRTQAVFVLVWLPVMLAVCTAGLCGAVRCVCVAVGAERSRWLVWLLLAAAAVLGYPLQEFSPHWLRWLLQSNAQLLFFLPLLLPLVVGKLHAIKEAKSHA